MKRKKDCFYTALRYVISEYKAQFSGCLLFVADVARAVIGLFSRNAHGPIMSLQTPSKKLCNKYLINLKRKVFTGKSQISALWY